jgi:surface polysaccharide O-acyltransferase-like enzyme
MGAKKRSQLYLERSLIFSNKDGMDSSLLSSKPNINSFFSEKIKVISFFAVIIVFYEHSGILDGPYKLIKASLIAYNITAGFWGNCAVPIFYSISGYLFFHEALKLSDILRKMKKRYKTLLIPFIIAALYYPLFFIIMELTPLNNYIDRGSYIDFCKTKPISDIINMLFYGSCDGYPWAYHLWFMRDLITIILLSPILFYLRIWLKYYSIFIPILLFLVFPQIRFLDALIWFLFGSLLLDRLQRIPTIEVWIISILYISFVLFRLITGDNPTQIERLIEIALGIISIWCMYDRIIPGSFCLSSHKWLFLACQFTFFIYLYHEPIFHIIVKCFVLAFGKNAIGYTLAIILPPLIFAPIGVTIGYNLRRFAPKLYGILVGGR